MTAQFHAHTVQKLYWALVETPLAPPAGTYTDWLVHNERHRRVRIAVAGQPGAKEARLDYRQLSGTVPFDRAGRVWLVEVAPRPDGSIRSACRWPITAIRSWATGSTAAGEPLPRGSPCTPAAWRLPIPWAASRSSFEASLPRLGAISASAADPGRKKQRAAGFIPAVARRRVCHWLRQCLSASGSDGHWQSQWHAAAHHLSTPAASPSPASELAAAELQRTLESESHRSPPCRSGCSLGPGLLAPPHTG